MKPLLLTDWQGTNPTGWVMSEKLDGWRVIWTGSEFISRENGKLNAPDWFLAGMPGVPLDGELFLGRGLFNGIQGAMRDGWQGLTFRVFDAPEVGGTFRQRLAFMRELTLPAHVSLVEQVRCRGIDHLLEFADEIVANGGEGAVIRDPKAHHVCGRTETVQRWVPQSPALNRVKSL
jgi:DNA ligase-1